MGRALPAHNLLHIKHGIAAAIAQLHAYARTNAHAGAYGCPHAGAYGCPHA